MARIATPARSRPRAATKASGRVARRAVKAVEPDASLPTRLAAKVAARVLHALARRAREAGSSALRSAAGGAAELSEHGLAEWFDEHRLPIQVGLDVAVPIEVAWREWMELASLPEGTHTVESIERDGDRLTGRTSGPRGVDWEAEVSDEREHESFAWRSVEGSDCAGLVTFHRLGDRLTRVELDIDVLPVGPAEAVTLALHLAHRRALADLRRFKARVEFISPDAYAPQQRNGRRRQGPEDEQG